jgi:hypothetical protein
MFGFVVCGFTACAQLNKRVRSDRRHRAAQPA